MTKLLLLLTLLSGCVVYTCPSGPKPTPTATSRPTAQPTNEPMFPPPDFPSPEFTEPPL